jgi:hypothetical protein
MIRGQSVAAGAAMEKVRELRVAKVLDEFKVVLNAGEEDGVKAGMVFVIFAIGEKVIDPDSKDILGRLEVVKGRVRIEHVQANMCIGHSSDTYERPRQLTGVLALQAGPELTETLPRRLENVAEGDRARRIG